MKVRATVMALAMVAALGLSGCSTRPASSSPDPQLEGTWYLIRATDRGSTVPTAAEDISLTIRDSAHTGGESPCSPYQASVTGGLGPVFVSATILGHGSDCNDPALNRVDDQYIDALGATRVASIEDGALVFTSPRSSLVYLRSLPRTPVAIDNTRWSLELAPDLRSSSVIQLTFGNANQLTLSTSCTATVAHYILLGDTILLRGVQTMPTHTRTCSAIDNAANSVLTSEFVVAVGAATGSGPATLVTSNRINHEPLIWRTSD